MKNIIQTNQTWSTTIMLSCIILLAVLTSCKKYLQSDPPVSSLEKSAVFANDGQAIAALTSIYTNILGSGNYASGGTYSITMFAGVSSDDLIDYDNTALPFYQNQLTPNISSISSLYSTPYKTIYISNAVLEGLIASNGVTQPVKQQLQGEALFMRAFAYFYLTNMFGEVPLQLTTDYRITSIASKSSVAEIYSQIVSDLKTAENLLLESYATTGRVRPNKSTVQALLARTYLYQKEWAEAEKYASIIIAKSNMYNLVAFDDIFKANSNEAIWQLMPPVNTIVSDAALYIPTATNVAPGIVSLNPDVYLNAFEANDKRQTSWVRNYTIGTTTYYYPYKYKNRTATVTEYSTVFRLAEQYLIRAEARINQGKIDIGISDLNIVRQRPLSTGINANTLAQLPLNLSQSEALVAVAKERRSELFSEWGHRWFDLKRIERANAVLSLIKPQWQPTDVLYPIPSNEMSRNQNITQNPGY
jgi:hypothetical protein